jgi:hypothetical protein
MNLIYINLNNCFQQLFLKTLASKLFFKKKTFPFKKIESYKKKNKCEALKRFTIYNWKLVFFSIYKIKKTNIIKILIQFEKLKISWNNILPKKLRNFEKIIKNKKNLSWYYVNFENIFKVIELNVPYQTKIICFVFGQIFFQNFVVNFQKDGLLEYLENLSFMNTINLGEKLLNKNQFNFKNFNKSITIISQRYLNLYRLEITNYTKNSISTLSDFIIIDNSIYSKFSFFSVFSKIEPWIMMFSRKFQFNYRPKIILGIKKNLNQIEGFFYKINVLKFQFYKKLINFFKKNRLFQFFYFQPNVNLKSKLNIPFLKKDLKNFNLYIFFNEESSLKKNLITTVPSNYIKKNSKTLKVIKFFSKIGKKRKKKGWKNEVFFKNIKMNFGNITMKALDLKMKKILFENILFSCFILKKHPSKYFINFQSNVLLKSQNLITFCSCFLFGIQNCYKFCLIF